MRIGVDLTLLRPGRLTGVERYAVQLVRALAARIPGDLVLFTGHVVDEATASLDVDQRRAPLASRIPIDQVWLPAAARRARVDLLHTLAFPTPLAWRGRAVLTLHDVSPWLFPEALSTGMRLYYRPLYPQALRRAQILTVSAASRSDIARVCGVPAERIRVTPLGVASDLFSRPATRAEVPPYLLFVGTIEPRKNLGRLIEALRLLRREGRSLDLVIVGRRGWGAPLDLGDVGPNVRITGQVSDLELARLYGGAACVVLPTLHEGFGLPLLEAMAAGVPAVASDIPALRELGADTVRYADPYDVGALARAVAASLDGGESTAALVRRARARAIQYTWDRCAEETLAAYRAVLTRAARTP